MKDNDDEYVNLIIEEESDDETPDCFEKEMSTLKQKLQEALKNTRISSSLIKITEKEIA